MTKPKPWVKVWRKVLDCKAWRWADESSRGLWLPILMLPDDAGRLVSHDDGSPLTPAQIADACASTAEKVEAAVAYYTSKGMLEEVDGVLVVTGFERHQRSPSAARVARYRDRQSAAAGDTEEKTEEQRYRGIEGSVTESVTCNASCNADAADAATTPAPKTKSSKRFTPPTVAEVADYCREKGYSIDPERFVDYNTARGWVVGKSPMKDWRAAVRTWVRNDAERNPAPRSAEANDAEAERVRVALDRIAKAKEIEAAERAARGPVTGPPPLRDTAPGQKVTR